MTEIVRESEKKTRKLEEVEGRADVEVSERLVGERNTCKPMANRGGYAFRFARGSPRKKRLKCKKVEKQRNVVKGGKEQKSKEPTANNAKARFLPMGECEKGEGRGQRREMRRAKGEIKGKSQAATQSR